MAQGNRSLTASMPTGWRLSSTRRSKCEEMAIVGIGAGIADYLFRSGILAPRQGEISIIQHPSLIASCKGADRSPTLRESNWDFSPPQCGGLPTISSRHQRWSRSRSMVRREPRRPPQSTTPLSRCP